MQALVYFTLFLLIVGVVFTRLLRVMAKRRKLRLALTRFRRRSAPVRTLSSREIQALEPLLLDPYSPRNKPISLLGHAVYSLEGEYRIDVIGSRDNYVLQHMIGPLEVILPFDAGSFLRDGGNRAEVVLTRRYAVVLRLNGEFELLQGEQRDRNKQRLDEDWRSGRTGPLRHVDPQAESAARQLAVPGTNLRIDTRVTILGQRNETPAEVAERRGAGTGLPSGVCWLLAFIALAIATGVAPESNTARLAWLAIAGLMAALGLYAFWRPRQPGRPGKVNRVSGELNLAALAGDTQQSPRLLLGNRLLLRPPPHWMPGIEPLLGRNVEAEVRVDDESLVSLGRALSIDQEVRQFKPVHWGRHITLIIVALAALLLLLINSPAPFEDPRQAQRWLQLEQRTFSSPESLLQANVEPGTPVVLRGVGRCELRDGPDAMPQRDCSRLFWGGASAAAGLDELNSGMAALYSGDFLRPRILPDHSPTASMAERQTPRYRATEPEASMALVSQACKDNSDAGIGDGCAALQQAMAARGFTDATDNEARIVLLGDDIGELRRLARQPASLYITSMVEKATEQLIADQRGTVKLQIAGASRAALPDSGGAPGRSLLERWEWLQEHAAGPEETPFDVTGFLTELSIDPASGVPLIHIDATRTWSQLWPPALRTLGFAAALALLLIHGSAAGINGWRQHVRRRAIAGVRRQAAH